MKITSELTDTAVLKELGARLERRRLAAGLTQENLADEAGVSKRTVERIEVGRSTDFVMLLRVLRVLRLIETFDQWISDVPQSPLLLLKSRGRTRKRVGHPRRPSDDTKKSRQAPPWKWRE
jgi:transcriptional regulator with XRE-family HTH domain